MSSNPSHGLSTLDYEAINEESPMSMSCIISTPGRYYLLCSTLVDGSSPHREYPSAKLPSLRHPHVLTQN